VLLIESLNVSSCCSVVFYCAGDFVEDLAYLTKFEFLASCGEIARD